MFDIDDVVRNIAGYGKIPDKDGDCFLEVEYEFAIPVHCHSCKIYLILTQIILMKMILI